MPETEIYLPSGDKYKLVEKAKELIQQCRVSVGARASYCRQIDSYTETGRGDGIHSLVNLLHYHEDRLAAHLYSPALLNFTCEAEQDYPKETLLRLLRAARLITKNWERTNKDMKFGEGVQSALRYGCTIFKQWVEKTETDGSPLYKHSLVMPWQFGVYREDLEELESQPAFVETSMLSLPEVWRRIYHMPDAKELYERIKTHAMKDNAGNEAFGSFHNLLSTTTLQTGLQSVLRPLPGGIVNINSSFNYSSQGPEIGVPTVPYHELWVWDEKDYTTVQLIEPDILIAPRLKKCNLLGPRLQPYTIIRPNARTNYFWGRPECADLIDLQSWISETTDDIKRLLAVQIDKILAFIGDEGITDDKYGQFRQAGWMNMAQGSDVKDLTPAFPPEIIPILDKLMEILDKIGGFGNILDGGGEPGVRSGNHAQTLIRTASPTLRDRSLLVERQCATAAHLTYELRCLKDATTYWTDPEKFEETSFTLGSLPDDAMVTVDSHSSSPIFADDHEQLIFTGVKIGAVDAESAIELLPFPQKDLLQQRRKEKALAQAAQLAKLEKEDPEAYARLLAKRK